MQINLLNPPTLLCQELDLQRHVVCILYGLR